MHFDGRIYHMKIKWPTFCDYSFNEPLDKILRLMRAMYTQWLHKKCDPSREKSETNQSVIKLEDGLIFLTRSGVKNQTNFIFNQVVQNIVCKSFHDCHR